MKKDDIDDDWDLVLCHRERVLARIVEISRRCRTHLRFDRGALIAAYTECRDIHRLAQMFHVSTSGITDALRRLVRFARRIEYDLQLKQAGIGRPFVVIVPLRTSEEAERLAQRLNQIGFEASIKRLAAPDR